MHPYDKTSIKINGRAYDLVYKDRDGRGDFVGFGFRIKDPKNQDNKGYIRVIISLTSTKVWAMNTTYPYKDREEAEDTARRAIDAVIPTLNLSLDPEQFANMPYRGDEITIQMNTNENSVMDNGFIINLTAHESPEEFVRQQLYGTDMSSDRIRNAILLKINRWESNNYELPYFTHDLEKDLFLPRSIVMRAVDYLANSTPPSIIKSPAGDDEFRIRLLPAGVDQVESLEQISAMAVSTFSTTAIDQSIHTALERVDASLVRSYEQVIQDINDQNKVSYRGTANEIREIVSGILRTLAPDEQVTSQPGYTQNPNTSGPTQAQRAKFIMSKKRTGSKKADFAKELELVETKVAGFIRRFYDRASDGTHRSKERSEIVTLHSYLMPILRDLLEVD